MFTWMPFECAGRGGGVSMSVCSCQRTALGVIPQVGREPGAEQGGERGSRWEGRDGLELIK